LTLIFCAESQNIVTENKLADAVKSSLMLEKVAKNEIDGLHTEANSDDDEADWT
jgi:hypothetical protein